MKLTNQTKYSLFYSDGTRLTYGNCLIACVASLLDEPIDEVPNVYTFYGLDEKDKTTEDHAWFKVMNLWLDLKHQKCIKKSSKKHQGTDQHWHHFNDAIQFYESLQLKSSIIKSITINIQSEQGSFSRTIDF